MSYHLGAMSYHFYSSLLFVAKRQFSYQNVLFASHKSLNVLSINCILKRCQILTDVNENIDFFSPTDISYANDKLVIVRMIRAIWKYFSCSFCFHIALAFGSCNIKEPKRTRKIFFIMHSASYDN